MKLRKILLGLAVTVGILVGTYYALIQLPAFGGDFNGARQERMRASPQFKDGRFENTPPQNTDLQLIKTIRLYSQGQIRAPAHPIPVVRLTTDSFTREPGLRAHWFGHSTVLVEIDGAIVLTDPVFSQYASPFQFVGPQRLHPAPIELEQLPRVDAVVISHDHYDHLDMDVAKHLGAQGTHYFVGLGIGAHLERWGVPAAQIHEMDWWESARISGIEIHCTPARHYSGRKRQDNSTLWASWFVKGAERSFYYSGDTGYAPHFAEIGRRLGSPDLDLIKIGAYGETWLDIHMAPQSAVQAHIDLGGRTLLPVHWATFNLSYHAWSEPIERTLIAAADEHVQVVIPRPGEKWELGTPFESTPWFRDGKAQ